MAWILRKIFCNGQKSIKVVKWESAKSEEEILHLELVDGVCEKGNQRTVDRLRV